MQPSGYCSIRDPVCLLTDSQCPRFSFDVVLGLHMDTPARLRHTVRAYSTMQMPQSVRSLVVSAVPGRGILPAAAVTRLASSEVS